MALALEDGAVALIPCEDQTLGLHLQCNRFRTWASVVLPWRGEVPTFVTLDGSIQRIGRKVKVDGETVDDLFAFRTGRAVDLVYVGLEAACEKLIFGARQAVPLLKKNATLKPVLMAEIATRLGDES